MICVGLDNKNDLDWILNFICGEILVWEILGIVLWFDKIIVWFGWKL